MASIGKYEGGTGSKDSEFVANYRYWANNDRKYIYLMDYFSIS
jgi:hypothetical protein